VADSEIPEVTGYVLWDWYSTSGQGGSRAFTVTLRPSLVDSSASYAETPLALLSTA